jgi:hypothetical protein
MIVISASKLLSMPQKWKSCISRRIQRKLFYEKSLRKLFYEKSLRQFLKTVSVDASQKLKPVKKFTRMLPSIDEWQLIGLWFAGLFLSILLFVALKYT